MRRLPAYPKLFIFHFSFFTFAQKIE